MKRAAMIFCAALIAAAAGGARAADDDSAFKVHWKEGLRLDSSDGSVKLKIGGRIQNDWAFYDSNDDIEAAIGEDIDDGTEFRRARLEISGEIYEHVIFKAQYDFAGGDAEFKDVFVGLQDLPVVGTLMIGHMFEPFSLEQTTSSKYITFLERSLPIALAFDRNTGIMVHNTTPDELVRLALGVFRDSDAFGTSLGDEYNFTGRLTGLPLYAAEDQLVHVGASYRLSSPVDDSLRVRSRPESHLAPNGFVDTRMLVPDPEDPDSLIPLDVAAEGFDALGAEAAAVLGPFSAQGEYIHWMVDGEDGVGDADLSGWYVFGSYFLTGEHRAYKKSDAVFDRIRPHDDFLSGGGPGAWEIAARYSTLDLDDGAIIGGEMHDITAALNWYLNPNTRVMFNYVRSELEDRTGLDGQEDLDIFQTRFQVDF